MADKHGTEMLESSALSAFCGSVATMLSAGIQTDEAVLMLSENRERSRFQEVCRSCTSAWLRAARSRRPCGRAAASPITR